jgi:predicted signal transduction protein with EAL and GGDEF domain
MAEGIEDAATWDALRAMGCDAGQGYHLARPMDDAELTAWLQARAAAGTGVVTERLAPLAATAPQAALGQLDTPEQAG